MLNFKNIPSCINLQSKDEVVDLVVALVRYAKMSREHGILYLKNYINDEVCGKMHFLRLMLYYLTDGIEMCDLEQIGKNYIETSGLSDIKRLKYMIITESVVDIMNGKNEIYLAEILGSYLGMEMRNAYRISLRKNKDTSSIELT